MTYGVMVGLKGKKFRWIHKQVQETAHLEASYDGRDSRLLRIHIKRGTKTMTVTVSVPKARFMKWAQLVHHLGEDD